MMLQQFEIKILIESLDDRIAFYEDILKIDFKNNPIFVENNINELNKANNLLTKLKGNYRDKTFNSKF